MFKVTVKCLMVAIAARKQIGKSNVGVTNFIAFYRKTLFLERTEEEERLPMIMEMLCVYYGQDSMALGISEKYSGKGLKRVHIFTGLAEVPAYAVKVIAETYGADFWKF